MKILDGKKYRDELLEKYKYQIESENLQIRLDIILVGNDYSSQIYVRNKIKYCEFVGIKTVLHHLDENIKEEELIELINDLNNDNSVTGIILQSPIPDHINFKKCAGLIDSKKDIDGFTMKNIDSLYHNQELLVPCTVKGIIKLLEHYNIPIQGKNVVIVGRGEIVGKPLSLALTNRNATVTLCHSKTKNLGEITKNAEILISAVGKEKLITGDMVKNDFIGVDVGITRTSEGKICGDFDFENVKEKASYITPVPGGVGPMTIAMIIDNLIYTCKL